MLAELSPEAMPEVKTQIDRLLDQLCSARSVTADEIAYLEGLRNKLAGAPPALSVEDEEDEEEQDEEDEEQDEEDEEQDEEDEDDEDEGPAGSLPAGGPAARRASTAQPTIQASAARSRPAAAAAQPTARIRTTYKPKPKTTPVDKAIARMKEGLPLSGGKRAKRR